MQRNHKVTILMTQEDKDDLLRRAEKAGLSTSEFCRRALSGDLMRGAPSPAVGELLFVLNDICNTLGQLLSQTKEETIAAEIRTERTRTQGLIDILFRVYGKKGC